MGFVLDAIVILLAVLMMWADARRGFADVLIRTAGRIAVFFLAAAGSSALAPMVFDAAFRPSLVEKVAASLPSGAQLGSAADMLQEGIRGLPGFLQPAVQGAVSSNSQLTSLLETASSPETAATALVDHLVSPVASRLISGVLFLLMMTLGFWLVSWLARAIRPMFRLPVLHGMNCFLGGLLGLLNAALLIIVLTALYYLFGTVLDIVPPPSREALDQSLIFSFFYEQNPLVSLVTAFTGW
nr:CvpA family protein [uncultured Solibaculum sp.]